MALFDICDSRGDFGERILPVDLRSHFPGLDQLRQDFQVLGGDVRLHQGDIFAAVKGKANQVSYAGESCDGSFPTLDEPAPEIRYRSVSDRVEYQVVPAALNKVVRGVVQNVIGTKRTHEFDVPRTGYPCHLGTIRLGDLDREAADTAGSSIDQHLLVRLDLSMVAKSLECGDRGHRNRSRLLERQARRLQRHDLNWN